MKYLKLYKLYESNDKLSLDDIKEIISDIKDILLEIEDIGYVIEIDDSDRFVLLGDLYLNLEVKITCRTTMSGRREVKTFTKKNILEITDSISRLCDYIRTQTDFTPQNSVKIALNNNTYDVYKYFIGIRQLDSNHSDFSWVDEKSKEWPFNTMIISFITSISEYQKNKKYNEIFKKV